MADRLQHGRDTAANWAYYNPILLEGEMGFIVDQPGKFKIGDGVTRWNNLPFYGGSDLPSYIVNDNFVESTDEEIAEMIREGTWLAGIVYYTTEDTENTTGE